MHSLNIELREFTNADTSLLESVFQDPKVMEYTLDDCFSNEELSSYHTSILSNNVSSTRRTYEYAVFHKNSFIGFADFAISQKNEAGGIAEIGYLLLPRFWGKGFGSLVAKKLIEICFTQHKLHRVYAKCNSNNLSSRKVLEKNGMQLEGVLRKQRFKKGQWMDEHIYALLNPNLPKKSVI